MWPAVWRSSSGGTGMTPSRTPSPWPSSRPSGAPTGARLGHDTTTFIYLSTYIKREKEGDRRFSQRPFFRRRMDHLFFSLLGSLINPMFSTIPSRQKSSFSLLVPQTFSSGPPSQDPSPGALRPEISHPSRIRQPRPGHDALRRAQALDAGAVHLGPGGRPPTRGPNASGFVLFSIRGFGLGGCE